jgi:hypothetical protein
VLDSAFISGVLPIFEGQPLLMHVYVFIHVGDFQEWRPAADWLRDDFFKDGHPVLCPANDYVLNSRHS